MGAVTVRVVRRLVAAQRVQLDDPAFERRMHVLLVTLVKPGVGDTDDLVFAGHRVTALRLVGR